jgi:DHA1 family bicyclomycin/chloramphenicol resistance-like MFS transporter
MAFGPLSVDMYLPALPAIGRSLGVGPTVTQSSVAAFFAGMAIGQLLYGPASDRIGRRPAVLWGLGLYLASSIACALATTYQVLVVARFFQALGASSGGVVVRAAVRDRVGHTETARTLSAMMLVSGLAPILAPLLGGAVLVLAGWRTIFWVLVAFGAAMSATTFLRLPETRSAAVAAHARSETPLRAYAALIRKPALIGYCLAGALNGATLFTYVSASPELLIGYYRFPVAQFGWVFSVNAVGLVVASQLNRRLLRTRDPDQVLRVSSVAAVAIAVGLAVVGYSNLGGRWAMLALMFAMLSTYGLLQGNALAGALSADPLRGGAASSLFGACSFAAGAAASFVTALFADGTPRPMVTTILIATMGSAIVLYGVALPKRRINSADLNGVS